MSQPKLSVLGMYNYNPDIFSSIQNITVFKAKTETDTETFSVFPRILQNCAELELLYPDADVLKYLIDAWVQSRMQSWQQMAYTLFFDYNPIYNYDRTEEWTEAETGNRKNANNRSGSSSGSTSGSGSNHSSTINSKWGFNSNDFSEADKSVTDGNDSSSTESSQNGTQTEALNEDTSRDNTKTGRAYGNIGVTTTQQMLEAERKIAVYDFVGMITDEFKSQFCICVY